MNTRDDNFKLIITGIVQGVGFRPFVYRIANQLGLRGQVFNDKSGVIIELTVDEQSLNKFVDLIRTEKPAPSAIDKIKIVKGNRIFADGFRIIESRESGELAMFISPDLATCEQCKKEILDVKQRRFGYPFTNCTNCGPRFTIIESLPYDRPNTSMKKFVMCADCRKEYEDPHDRRFHAQPIACPVCGPKLSVLDSTGREIDIMDPIEFTVNAILDGKIVALKGIGGYQLACDATSENAVIKLRQRKQRPHKPFALMFKDINNVRKYCYLTRAEEELLLSSASPIVLLRSKQNKEISDMVAPNNRYHGAMIPYTPLHELIFAKISRPLVMTSGNISEEPIAFDNKEALSRLGSIADCFLTNDRPIISRYDDSVVFALGDDVYVSRRARGYAPYPVKLNRNFGQILACGSQYKNSFCLTRQDNAYLSQHIGDLDTLETYENYVSTIETYKRIFNIKPEICAYDLHPDYTSSKYGLSNDIRLKFAVQHHIAHISSVIAEHDLYGESIIGVALDGTGYGSDGNVWGGEVFLVDKMKFTRLGGYRNVRLPGGDAGIERPYRMAISYLYDTFKENFTTTNLYNLYVKDSLVEDELNVILGQIRTGFNSPYTSSCGRLFDGVSSILGQRQICTYEGQAAIELESLSESDEHDVLPYGIDCHNGLIEIDCRPMFCEIENLLNLNTGANKIAKMFHNTIVVQVIDVCLRVMKSTGVKKVALGGGVMQNRLILGGLLDGLRASGFEGYVCRYAPLSDGGISLGQAAYAQSLLEG